MNQNELTIFLTKEDARLYMISKTDEIWSMSFSFKKSKAFDTEVKLIFKSDLCCARQEKALGVFKKLKNENNFLKEKMKILENELLRLNQ